MSRAPSKKTGTPPIRTLQLPTQRGSRKPQLDVSTPSLSAPRFPVNRPSRVPDVVDAEFYSKAYKDVQINGSNSQHHFDKYGRVENRLPSAGKFMLLYPEFDSQVYMKYNKDIVNFSEEELMSHFHHHGRFEGRLYKKEQYEVDVKPSEPDLLTETVMTASAPREKRLTIEPFFKKPYMDENNLRSIDRIDLHLSFDVHLHPKLSDLLASKGQDKPVYLVMAEWGYPPFGGGECWLIDTMRWLHERGFACYYIYFYDNLKKSAFEKINIIKCPYGDFIQFTPDYLQLLQCVKQLDPVVISHQGFNRLKYLKIATLLGKPFMTGFCFWGDILKMASSDSGEIFNQQMMTKELKQDPHFATIHKQAAYTYVCGKFVQDIVKKVHNVDIDVINTISDESHYKIESPQTTEPVGIYVTVINICGLKGGLILESLINQTSLDIPFILVDSQEVGSPLNVHLGQLIQARNAKETSHKSIYIRGAFSDVKSVYKRTRILLVPSLVDETFCRVGYEGMMNDLPVLSTRNGNLRYLMDGYADFMDENPDSWASAINKIYHDSEYLQSMSKRPKPINSESDKSRFVQRVESYLPPQFRKNIPDSTPTELSPDLSSVPPTPAPTLTPMTVDAITVSSAPDSTGATPTAAISPIVTLPVLSMSPPKQSSRISSLSSRNIGIVCPWADQGLGIQCREYYEILKRSGYSVSVLSFRPYHATAENPRLQTDSSEWDYSNIYYSKNTRETLSESEVIDYIYHYRIKKLIIVETCYDKIFEIARVCRLLSIQVYAIPNLETLRFMEIHKHQVFDKIICNNQMTYDLMSVYFPDKVNLLGFRILNKNYSNQKNWNRANYSFFCCGGLNALSRKNVDKVVQAFRELDNEKKTKNFKLYVYIQGVEIPEQISRLTSKNLVAKVGARPYREIAQLYKDHDVFIHMGDHEGLGLGFYESIACGTPVMTIDTPPNNEIIKEGQNGWLVKCSYVPLNDNNFGIVKRASITVQDVKDKMLSIINTYNRKSSYEATVKDYLLRYPIWHYQETLSNIFGPN